MANAADGGDKANGPGRAVDPGPSPSPDRWAIRSTWLVFALLATMVGFSVAPLVNHGAGRLNKDYVLWYATGRAVAEGRAIYPEDGRTFPFMYPPSAAALLAILSHLGETAFLVALLLGHCLAWAAGIALSLYLVSGRVARHHPALYLVPSLGVLPYVHDAYLLGQTNMALLALMLGALACLAWRRSVAAGSLVALAAAIKAFPFLGVGYLIYRRYWRATAAFAVALALLVLALPMPFRGVANAFGDAGTWTMGMVLRYDSGSIAQRPERGFGHKNQSLMAVANRLLRDIPADGEARDGWQVNVASLSFEAVNRVILASALGLGLLYVALMPWRRPEPGPGPTVATEGALLILLILAFSPLSFNYSFVWLLFPLTVALHFGLEAPRGSLTRRGMLGAVGGALILLGLSLVSARTAAGYGNSLAAAGLLFAALAARLATDPTVDSPFRVMLARLRRPGRANAPRPADRPPILAARPHLAPPPREAAPSRPGLQD